MPVSRRDGRVRLGQIPSFHRPADRAGSAERIGLQLPCILVANRIAHHLKVIQRERLGGIGDRSDIERELNAWLSQHIADMDSADDGLRSLRPLRGAALRVADVPGQPGWLRAELEVRPHVRGTRADVALTIHARIDRGAR
jgi:type VI secretion system protein ImpC